MEETARAQRLTPPNEWEMICAGELIEFELPPFEVFDKNGDHVLDEDEVSDCESLRTLFSRLDLDANQLLGRAEYDGFADIWSRRARAFGGVEDLGKGR